MIDFETDLHDRLDRAASGVHAPPDLLATIERRITTQRRRGAAVRVAGALVVVALAAGLALVATGGGDGSDGSTRATDPGGTTAPAPDGSTTLPPTPPVTSSGTWTTMADAPIPGRTDAMAVDMDGEVLVWGGDAFDLEPRVDGAVYETATDTWRTIPESPLPGGGSALGAWTGSVALVLDWNGGALALASFDPASDTWARLADPPGSFADGIATMAWADDRLVFVSSLGTTTRVATYDPATDAWTEGTEPTVTAPAQSDVVWTGDEVLMVGELIEPDAVEPGPVGAVAYDPAADTWRTVPLGLAPLERYGVVAAWTGTHLLVGGGVDAGGAGLADAGLLDPATGTWTPLPDAPEPFSGSAFGPEVWTGTQVVALAEQPGALGGTPVAFDTTTGGWIQGPESPTRVIGATAVWSGDRIVIPLGGDPAPTPDDVCCRTGPAGGLTYTP